MKTQSQEKNTLGAALIIAGTCIGAGMLALPVETGLAGFLPAMFVSSLCWIYMLCTGFLFLEATLWLPDGANVASIAKHFLGRTGEIVVAICFLFLYYCLELAYLSAGAPAFFAFVKDIIGLNLEGWPAHLLFAALVSSVIWMGTLAIDRVNFILMCGLIFSYLLLIGIGQSEVEFKLLTRTQWNYAWAALPILFSAYGFHNVIPSLSTYLKRNTAQLKNAILIGMLIPFLIYSIWQWIIIGSIDFDGIQEAAVSGTSITNQLEQLTGRYWISRLGLYFGFFAIVTSLLGVSMSMVDFLGDAFKIKDRSGFKRLGLCVLALLPPLLLSKSRPELFREALGYAGGFGEAILNGFFPIVVVWIGRYRLKLKSPIALPGGKICLSVLFIMTVIVVLIELAHVLGLS
jgi:tyrosine-specific transport protein